MKMRVLLKESAKKIFFLPFFNYGQLKLQIEKKTRMAKSLSADEFGQKKLSIGSNMGERNVIIMSIIVNHKI